MKKEQSQFLLEQCKIVVNTYHKNRINHFDNDDLTQELFIKVWERMNKYDKTKGKFSTFFSRVAYNSLMTLLNKSKYYNKFNFMSLDNKIEGEDNTSFVDYIESNFDYIAHIENKICIEQIENKIRGKRKKQVFNLLSKGYRLTDIAEITNTTIQNISKISRNMNYCFE